ncbi:MAG TPA: hypothetical protein VF314_18165 [Actinomycetes bacterium]
MRTVLCTTAGRRALLLVLAAGTAGVLALPATAADGSSSSRHTPPGPAPASAAGEDDGNGAAVLGPAVTYVRDADGAVRRVR